MNEMLNGVFSLYILDIKYIQLFILKNFGNNQILSIKNQGKILPRDYSIKNSRIKGYAFHGYGCLFQFRDFYLDIDLRFGKVGFTTESLLKYLQQKKIQIEAGKIDSFLKMQIELKIIEFDDEGVYLPI